MSGEKKRLEQFLLQRSATAKIDPRFGRFQPVNIDRIRLLSQQRLAGQVPISDRLKKEQKKRKKKARRTKKLRGDVAQNIREQRRFAKGERRDKDTEEPLIVGDPKPLPAGMAYDPEIERRRLDIQQGVIDQNRLDRITDRAESRRRFDEDLGVRRGELAGARADRALIRAAIPAPALPAPGPVVNIAAPPPAQVRVEAPQVRVEGPTVNIPQLPARSDADPIPEIQRLGAELRADTNAYGQEQAERNRASFAQLRDQISLENRQTRETVEAIDRRTQAQDENFRSQQLQQDARYQELDERLGSGEAAMGETREEVLREIRESEERLRTANEQLDRPTNYDSVLLEQAQFEEQLRAQNPTGVPATSPFDTSLPHGLQPPREELREPEPESDAPAPVNPLGISGVIEGGGELDLPAVVIDRPAPIEPTESPASLTSSQGRAADEFFLQEVYSGSDAEPSPEQQRLSLSPAEQARVYPRGTGGGGAARGGAGGLRTPQALQEVELDEEEEAAASRLRLVDTQDFLSGFARPSDSGPGSPQPEPEPAPEAQALSLVPEITDRVIQGSSIGDAPPQPQLSERSTTPTVTAPSFEELRQELEEVKATQKTLRPQVEAFLEPEGRVQNKAQQRIRNSKQLYESSFGELSQHVRAGPKAVIGSRGGLGYRVRNNTDQKVQKIEPGDVVDVIGVQAGPSSSGTYRLNTKSKKGGGSSVELNQLGPLINDGSLLFEKGHRYELGGHFDREPFGPVPAATRPSASQLAAVGLSAGESEAEEQTAPAEGASGPSLPTPRRAISQFLAATEPGPPPIAQEEDSP